jgi:transposase
MGDLCAKQLEEVGLETGSWSSWLFCGLSNLRFNGACMDARQARDALSITVNTTDANGVEGLTLWLRRGLSRKVCESMVRFALAAILWFIVQSGSR